MDREEQVIASMRAGAGQNPIVALVDRFYSDLVMPMDQRFLDFAFRPHPVQADLDRLLADWDIEEAGGGKALLLAYVMKAHPELKFSAYVGPRLDGLLRYYRFQNLTLISHFTKIGRALNADGCRPLLIKGGAMKYLRPELSRCMGDIDIVMADDAAYEKAGRIAAGMGYVFETAGNSHSIDLHWPGSEAGLLDIHRFLDLDVVYDRGFMREVFSRAQAVRIFGVDSFLPSPEDLVFIALTNLAKNLYKKHSIQGILYTVFDCHWLPTARPGFQWKQVLSDAQRTGTQYQLALAVSFVDRIVPHLLPEFVLADRELGKAFTAYCNKVYFSRFYVHEVKMRCKKLRLADALRHWGVFKQYLHDKPRHFILKRINRHPALIALFLKYARS